MLRWTKDILNWFKTIRNNGASSYVLILFGRRVLYDVSQRMQRKPNRPGGSYVDAFFPSGFSFGPTGDDSRIFQLSVPEFFAQVADGAGCRPPHGVVRLGPEQN